MLFIKQLVREMDKLLTFVRFIGRQMEVRVRERPMCVGKWVSSG